jgi:hypothetical protein
MNKKLLIIAVIILLCFLIVSFILSRNLKNEIVKSPNLSQAQSIGTSPRYPMNDNQVSFSLSSTVTDPPSVLTEYETTFLNSLDNQVIVYANSLGFSSPTRTSNRFIEWTNEKGRFLFNKEFFSISLSQHANSNSFFSSAQNALESMSDFFTFPTLLETTFLYSRSPTISGGAVNESPIVTEYSYTISGYPVFYSATDPAVFIVHSNESQPFTSMMFRIPPETITFKGEVPLFTKNQIPLLLEQNKGVLQAVYSINDPTSFETTPSFTSIEIQSLAVGYLFISEEQKLVPVYILEGIGTGKGEIQKVRYILRAST